MSNINSSVEKRPYFYKLLDEKQNVEYHKCGQHIFHFSEIAMMEDLFSRPTIHFIKNCQVNVPVQRHLDALPSEPSTQNGAFLRDPLHSIQFKDANLSNLRKLVKDKQFSNRRLVSLRNLLMKRKKEESGRSILTVFANMDDELRTSYVLHFDNDLLKKIVQAFECIVIFVHVRIEWTEKAELEQPQERERQWAQYECNPYEIKRENLFNTNVEIPVNLRNSSECAGVSEKVLKRLGSNDNLVFNWNVAIQFDKIASDDLRIQRRLDTEQDLFDLPDSAKDVTFIASNGDEIKCHRKVLIEMSANFSGSEKGTLDRIEIKESSTEALKLFVNYFYGFEIQEFSLTPDLAIELLKLSNRYEVKTLEEALVDFFTSKPFSWFSLGSLMELYFFTKDKQNLEEIRIHALTELAELNKKDLDKCEYFKNLPQKEAISLLLLILEWK